MSYIGLTFYLSYGFWDAEASGTSELAYKVFLSLHSLSHPGARATSKMIRQWFVWPHIVKDIRAWCRECLSCLNSNVHQHTSTAPSSFPLPSCRFQHIHMDLVGPLPASNGHTHILTIIDQFIRWPVAIPLTDTSTETVLRTLTSGWIANLRMPETITTDRGSLFSSHLFHQVSKLLNSLSPRSKWNDRTLPLATQGGTHRAQLHRCMDRSPTRGFTWNPCNR